MFWMIFSSITDVGSMWIFVETDNGFSTCCGGAMWHVVCCRLHSSFVGADRQQTTELASAPERAAEKTLRRATTERQLRHSGRRCCAGAHRPLNGARERCNKASRAGPSRACKAKKSKEKQSKEKQRYFAQGSGKARGARREWKGRPKGAAGRAANLKYCGRILFSPTSSGSVYPAEQIRICTPLSRRAVRRESTALISREFKPQFTARTHSHSIALSLSSRLCSGAPQ